MVKGGEGLRQPFTTVTHRSTGTYVRKVKGEGFLRIFFCPGLREKFTNAQYHPEGIPRAQ